jgi:hypothetical protein
MSPLGSIGDDYIIISKDGHTSLKALKLMRGCSTRATQLANVFTAPRTTATSPRGRGWLSRIPRPRLRDQAAPDRSGKQW